MCGRINLTPISLFTQLHASEWMTHNFFSRKKSKIDIPTMKSWKNPSHHSNSWWTFAFKWNSGECDVNYDELELLLKAEIVFDDFPRNYFNLMGFSRGKNAGRLNKSTVEKFKTRNYDWRQNLEKNSTTWQVINRFTNRITSLGGGAENLRIKHRQIKRSFPCRQQIPQSSLWINRYAYEFVACLIFAMFNNRSKILLITHWTCAVTHDIYAVTYFRKFQSNMLCGNDNKICNVEN